MEKAPTRDIVGRRSRPAKPALSRDIIVSTALAILERDGLAGLSLRRVASALDTGAASLYVYLTNLDELHALMLDAALAAVTLPQGKDLPWRDRLKGFLAAYFHVLYERPGLAQLALSTIAAGPNSLRILEQLLDLLGEGGVDDGKAAWGVDLLLLYVTAIAAEQSNWRAKDMNFGRVKDVLSAVSAQEFPHIFALKEAFFSGGEDRSAWALDVIIDGILGGRRSDNGVFLMFNPTSAESAQAGFAKIYAESDPPWDIGKPQPPFIAVADQITGPVLDSGCGTGGTSLFFAARGLRVTGIDFVEEAIARARAKAVQRGLTVDFLVKDAMTLGEWNQRFASVIDSGLFHIYEGPEQQAYVRGLAHVLLPGGRLFLFSFAESASAPGGGMSRQAMRMPSPMVGKSNPWTMRKANRIRPSPRSFRKNSSI